VDRGVEGALNPDAAPGGPLQGGQLASRERAQSVAGGPVGTDAEEENLLLLAPGLGQAVTEHPPQPELGLLLIDVDPRHGTLAPGAFPSHQRAQWGPHSDIPPFPGKVERS